MLAKNEQTSKMVTVHLLKQNYWGLNEGLRLRLLWLSVSGELWLAYGRTRPDTYPR